MLQQIYVQFCLDLQTNVLHINIWHSKRVVFRLFLLLAVYFAFMDVVILVSYTICLPKYFSLLWLCNDRIPLKRIIKCNQVNTEISTTSSSSKQPNFLHRIFASSFFFLDANFYLNKDDNIHKSEALKLYDKRTSSVRTE